MRILLITGGDSSEREVSLISAENVKKTLEENGHKVLLYDLRDGYEPIIKLSEDYDILFPVLHGEEGEGGKLHEFLSKVNRPIVGTRNYKGMSSAWHKIPFKQFCDKYGIGTSSWNFVKTKQDILDFGFPCVLKASNGGSSREVVIIKTERDLEREDTRKLLKSQTNLYVEKFLKGTEVTVGILDGKTIPIIEIIPPEGEFFSYENKYTPRTQEIPFAPSLDPKLQAEIQKIALRIHNHFNLGSYSRIDFIVLDGIPYVLEINTIPGLTAGSLMLKAAKAAGISFNELIEILLKSSK